MLQSLRLLLCFSLSCLCLTACATGDPPDKKSELLSVRPNIATILASSGEAAEQTVQLDVTFSGWRGNCSGTPPISRSDWMVEDLTGCIYVHGSLPSGLDPVRPEPLQLTIVGQLKKSKSGRAYIELEKVLSRKKTLRPVMRKPVSAQ